MEQTLEQRLIRALEEAQYLIQQGIDPNGNEGKAIRATIQSVLTAARRDF